MSHGFWLSRWYKDNSEGQSRLVEELARTMDSGKVSGLVDLIRMSRHMSEQFKEPKHEIIEIGRDSCDEMATSAIREVFRRMALGEVKKKVILKVEGIGA